MSWSLVRRAGVSTLTSVLMPIASDDLLAREVERLPPLLEREARFSVDARRRIGDRDAFTREFEFGGALPSFDPPGRSLSQTRARRGRGKRMLSSSCTSQRASGYVRARPRPLKIEPANPSVHVEDLANEKQSRAHAGRHRGGSIVERNAARRGFGVA
jgi:hypothetical protein